MSDAPERIWATPDDGYCTGDAPQHHVRDALGFVEYARLDTVYTREQVEAMVAEALGDAVRFVVGIEPGNRRWIRRDAVLAHLVAAIRAQGEAV